MKIGGRQARGFFARPGNDHAAMLLHGGDPVRIAMGRETLVKALIGPEGAAEMRLARMSGAEIARDPAALDAAVRASGFFPGARAVLVEEAGDGASAALKSVLADWREGDARIVVTAGALKARSSLRKLFEGARNAASIAIYDDPPDRAEIAADLEAAGLGRVPAAALEDLEALGRSLDPGDFARFLEKLALYKLGDDTELSPEDVAACAPVAPGADLDTLIDLAAEGRPADLAAALARIGAQSGAPTRITIAAARHFRLLHAAAIAKDGAEAALSRARPPVFGPRRTRLAAQARRFGPDRAETVLGLVFEAEMQLRSGRPVPASALVERLLVRIAALAQPRSRR